MKILRWYGKRDMRLENVEKPTPGRGDRTHGSYGDGA